RPWNAPFWYNGTQDAGPARSRLAWNLLPGSSMTPTRHILLVDDDPAMREMLESLFEARGYRTSCAPTADAALALCADTDFDVVLSDIRMPGRSGVELVGELHRLRPETPVVLMTAFGSIDSAVSALRAGARDYVTKPFEPDTALLAVER